MLTDIVISHENGKYELERLNCFKRFGPDGIHLKFLKYLFYYLAYDSKFGDAVGILFKVL